MSILRLERSLYANTFLCVHGYARRNLYLTPQTRLVNSALHRNALYEEFVRVREFQQESDRSVDFWLLIEDSVSSEFTDYYTEQVGYLQSFVTLRGDMFTWIKGKLRNAFIVPKWWNTCQSTGIGKF